MRDQVSHFMTWKWSWSTAVSLIRARHWDSIIQYIYSCSSGPWHPWLQWVSGLVQSDTGKRFWWPEARDSISPSRAVAPTLCSCGWHRLIPWRISWDTSHGGCRWAYLRLHHWPSVQASSTMWQILVSTLRDVDYSKLWDLRFHVCQYCRRWSSGLWCHAVK